MITFLHKMGATAGTPSSLVGLALDGDRLDGTLVRLVQGVPQAVRSFSATLALDPLTHEPELVGREILNHLEAVGIRERRCVMAVPLKWALTTEVKVPPLPEADLASFMQIEAERAFPCDIATLCLATSRGVESAGETRALVAGIPLGHLGRLESALRAARLTPLSFGLGIAALQPPAAEATEGVLAVAIGASQVELEITWGGAVALLRVLDGVYDAEDGDRVLHGDRVTRELRITLGQLTPGLREAVKRMRIFGAAEPARQLAAELRARLQPAGLTVEVVADASGGALSSAFCLAAGYLGGRKPPFEFLPPRVSSWKRMTARYTSGTWRRAGTAAAALVALVGLSFAVQQWQLARWGARWARMATTVHELEGAQQQIQRFRAWDDTSFRCLTILRGFSNVFPEDGDVTAKTLEIRNMKTVNCTGTARDHAALLRMLGQLRSADNVQELRVVQIRGGSPIQFTFEFQYGERGSRAN